MLGEFNIGADRSAADTLFDRLKGRKQFSDQAALHMDVKYASQMLPKKSGAKCCGLEEFACNWKTITRETFRQKSLKTDEE